ncbi:DEAD/DEAH box helicase [Paraliomyxa miuraensis]|uniref:DEAD/DEAH box helicase n=1 Tax=Paraliomyxa miuraensis TaxID=376150 RepID=UPI00225549BA|nr:DEAD/DEAH box helicase [Paraliomyxa miuraensis]MCX4239714.1 DEAD/DEAH box helicase [Paraliomyxa miuraensis]
MSIPAVSTRVPVRDVLLPGTPVRARGLTWEIVHAEQAGEQLRYRLRCTQGDLRGREIDLLSPFEQVDAIVTALDPKRAGPLQEWLLYHRAFLLEQALGPSALQAVQPGRLDIAPYQIVPVMRVLSLSRPRLLLADGVGLGKTVEAGLIIAELIARRRAHRVLIVSPAGPLLVQWQSEMRQRFGLRFEAIGDWSTLQEKRRQLVLGANPFDHMSLCLLSIDFAKQDKIMLDLERASWDLVIIDEAHHCVSLGGAGDREDSRRRRLAELLARQSDGLLLLTATPHDGYDEHFASLLELLDPSLVDGRRGIRGDGYRRHVVRRLKHHIKKPGTDEPMFRDRDVVPHPVEFSADSHPVFSALQASILALVAPRLKQAIRRRQFGEVLAFVSLLKRSVSTVRACQKTLGVIAERYGELVEKGQEQEEARKQRLKTLSDYRRRVERYGAASLRGGTIPPCWRRRIATAWRLGYEPIPSTMASRCCGSSSPPGGLPSSGTTRRCDG